MSNPTSIRQSPSDCSPQAAENTAQTGRGARPLSKENPFRYEWSIGGQVVNAGACVSPTLTTAISVQFRLRCLWKMLLGMPYVIQFRMSCTPEIYAHIDAKVRADAFGDAEACK